MIFVTIGAMRGFDRLIKKMDEIAGRIDEKVIMQIGSTKYKPENAEYFFFMSSDKMVELYKNMRILVCHAGIGSILMGLEFCKPVIAVPRRKKFGELIDDHQIEIARELEKEGLITVVYDVENLEEIVKNISYTYEKKSKNVNILVKKLNEYLDEMEKKNEYKN